ncbi:hypothetical protein JW968_05130 [Candidatus Woesearchaeota archaeon]|nr:hypothetical protein [Candidatus Woesearchaeota archaeon]
MIFGLFLLLIISLVVLNLFFKFTEKSSTKMQGASTEYFQKAAKEQAIQDCQAMCDNIKDIGSLMKFCKSYHSLDWNYNQIANDKISEGLYDFCENKIPCFILVDDCGQTSTPVAEPYDGETCRNVLKDWDNNRVQWLVDLSCDGNANDFEGSCGLDPTSRANWYYKYNYSCTWARDILANSPQ